MPKIKDTNIASDNCLKYPRTELKKIRVKWTQSKTENLNSLKKGPDSNGKFGIHGGRFVAETLMPLIEEVEIEYNKIKNNKKFYEELNYYLINFRTVKIFCDSFCK